MAAGNDLIFGGDGHDGLKDGDGGDTIDGGMGDDADIFNYIGMLDAMAWSPASARVRAG